MTVRCVKHPFETAVTTCRECGYDYCGECLVYSFGANKPPYCVKCALAAAGVRRGSAVTPVRAQKSRRLFGRRAPVVTATAGPTFDEIPITFPKGLVPGNETPQSEIAPEVTRRDREPAYTPPEPALVGAERNESLSDWAASLDEPAGTTTAARSFESLSGYGGSHDDFDSFADFPAPPASGGFSSGFESDGVRDSGFATAAWPEGESSGWSSTNTADADWSGAAPWPAEDDSSGGSFF